MLPLFKQFPSIEKNVDFMSLGNYPTPVNRLTQLEKDFPVNSLWIKRDDKSCDAHGGNKIRKLEFEFGKIIKQDKKAIIAYGSMGSNFTFACCHIGKKIGLPVHLILYQTYKTEHVIKNYQANCKSANSVELIKSPLLIPYYISLIKRRYQLKDAYIMPPGGSSPLSILGFINAMFELQDQIDKNELPIPAYLFLPVGTGGTIAGLLIGKVLLDLPTKIIGFAVVEKILTNLCMIKLIIYRTIRFFNKVANYNISYRDVFKELYVDYNFLGKGYAHPTKESNQAIDLLKEKEGITLDRTYTGKAIAGTLHYLSSHLNKKNNALIWHTYTEGVLK